MSSVDTTAGIREGARTTTIDRPTNTQPTRKAAGKKPKQFIQWNQYPLLVKQYSAYSYKLPFDTVSTSMTRLMLLAREGTRKSVVTNVVRQEDLDSLGLGGTKGAKKEFLVYYTSETARDRNNKPLPSCHISHGIDYLCEEEERYDDSGEELTPELGRQRLVHTVLWSKEAFDKALEGQDTENRRKPIQFSVAKIGGQSFGNFTYEEMANLSFKELLERGRLGRSGEDLSISFSSLSTKDKLTLQKEVEKKQ
jgi:hypothetical protein